MSLFLFLNFFFVRFPWFFTQRQRNMIMQSDCMLPLFISYFPNILQKRPKNGSQNDPFVFFSNHFHQIFRMFCMEEHEYPELLCLGFCLKILSAQHWNDGEQIGFKMDLQSFCRNELVIKFMRIYIRLKSVQMSQKQTQK